MTTKPVIGNFSSVGDAAWTKSDGTSIGSVNGTTGGWEFGNSSAPTTEHRMYGDLEFGTTATNVGKLRFEAASGDRIFINQTITATFNWSTGVDSSNNYVLGAPASSTSWSSKFMTVDTGGRFTFGPSSSDSRNLFVNGHIRSNGKITGAGVSVPSGTNGPTAFLTENDVVKSSCSFLLVINIRSQSTPGRGATGLYAVSTHAGGTCTVVLISSTAIGGGHSLVAGAPGASQIGIVGNNNAGTWELQWQNNAVFDNYGLSYEIVGGTD